MFCLRLKFYTNRTFSNRKVCANELFIVWFNIWWMCACVYAFDRIWMRYIGVNTAGSVVSVASVAVAWHIVQQVTLFHSIASCALFYLREIYCKNIVWRSFKALYFVYLIGLSVFCILALTMPCVCRLDGVQVFIVGCDAFCNIYSLSFFFIYLHSPNILFVLSVTILNGAADFEIW